MIILFALIASSFAQVPCDQAFFRNVKQRAADYVEDTSRKLKISSAATGAAAATARGAVESVQQYGQMHAERQAAFSRVYRGGAGETQYLRHNLHGRPIYPTATTAKIPASVGDVLKRLGFQTLIAAEVYFYMDPSPKRCNATLDGAAKTQEIVGGQCVDKLTLSENTVEFLSRPLADQEKLASQFPSVCEFYKRLYPTLWHQTQATVGNSDSTAVH
jgi:hypothetical protein